MNFNSSSDRKTSSKQTRKNNQQSQNRQTNQSSAQTSRKSQNNRGHKQANRATKERKILRGGKKLPAKSEKHIVEKKNIPIKIAFLGGLNEIGKNITLFECENDIVIIDCGMAFPDIDMLGVDLVIPDFSYVLENKSKIRGIILTHGHEDHIGALPYLLKDLKVPVYSTALTIGLVQNKLSEHDVGTCELRTVKAGDKIEFGCMTAELIHVNHSIPDTVAVALHTPGGTIVHTGDFKIDFTPTTDEIIDLAKFASLGQQGVLALMADSTNAQRPGYTMTEQTVNESFEHLFARAENSRIIIATFASNISRVQQIINCSQKFKRKVAFTGRSMINYISTAKELGYLKVPDGIIVDIDELNTLDPGQSVVVSTGSQGEPMSALYRMAFSDHKKVCVGAGDFIIISANPIPGNEKMVGTVVDELLKRGCEIVYESMYEVHVSGHACREELKIMHALTKPKLFIPVHGEQKHLKKHADLAMSMGMPKQNIYIGDIGSCIEISQNGIKELALVTSGNVFVDGLGVGDVGSIVLRDRKLLSEDGLIVVVAGLDTAHGELISGPDIVSRGFVYVKESEDLLEGIREIATSQFIKCMDDKMRDHNSIKSRVKESILRYITAKTGRTPMILTIIVEL